MNKKRNSYASVAVSLLTAASLLATGVPAVASTFTVSADRTSDIKVAGDVINVSLTNLPANSGVYIRLCKATADEASRARPQVCADMRATKWVTNAPMAVAQGGTLLTGSTVALPVTATFVAGTTNVNCAVDACGVHIRRDHLGGATDFALDRFIPITFTNRVTAQSDVVLANSRVTFTVANQKGKRITFQVGNRKFTRTATSKSFTFSVKAPKRASFESSAFVGSRELVSKRLAR